MLKLFKICKFANKFINQSKENKVLKTLKNYRIWLYGKNLQKAINKQLTYIKKFLQLGLKKDGIMWYSIRIVSPILVFAISISKIMTSL